MVDHLIGKLLDQEGTQEEDQSQLVELASPRSPSPLLVASLPPRAGLVVLVVLEQVLLAPLALVLAKKVLDSLVVLMLCLVLVACPDRVAVTKAEEILGTTEVETETTEELIEDLTEEEREEVIEQERGTPPPLLLPLLLPLCPLRRSRNRLTSSWMSTFPLV